MTNKEAIKELRNIARFNYTLAPPEVFTMAIEALKEQRPHGEWVKSDNKYKGEWKCSVCEKYASFYNNPYKDKSDFCPNCGADMRKEGG